MARKKAKLAAPRKVPKKAAAGQRPARFPRKERGQPESLSVRSGAPGFTVKEIEKSVAWYRDGLGFTVKERWEHEGKLAGVELAAAECRSCSRRTTGGKVATF